MAVEMKILQLKVYSDLLAKTPDALPRTGNGPADALAGIAANLAQFDNRPSQVPICKRWVVPLPIEEEAEEEREEKEESLPISIHKRSEFTFAVRRQSTSSSMTSSTGGRTRVFSYDAYLKKKVIECCKKPTVEFVVLTRLAPIRWIDR
ncbi:hypothetical protein H6P81_002890 [Aristolochia fimbriata]|uniref:Uncharacterized protein n=1 Tax=Aristolochia fimbriata TaxID=158543 RepID=A0AAV7FEA0_ARIFI|nr:hypothetical protein H6P81_002890 [Aristolochia fimbriata]